MKLFKVTVSAVKKPQWWNHASAYQVWAKDKQQAEQAVYDRYKNCGLNVGKSRISARIYNARKPIVRIIT